MNTRSVLSFIALGANLGDVRATLDRALSVMNAWDHSSIEASSHHYRNPAMAVAGQAAQPDYVNAVAALRTQLAPLPLLDALQDLERAAGRIRDGRRWQARTLDLDLLLYDGAGIDEPRLKIPHPAMHLRAFVIHPLAEIAPQIMIPGHGTAQDIAQNIDASMLEILPFGDHIDKVSC